MSDDLDELELRPETDHDEEPLRPRPTPPGAGRGRLFPFLLVAVGLVVVAGVSALVFLLQPWKDRGLRTPSPTPAPSAAGSPTPQAGPPVPSLDASDAYVRALASGLSAHPELARWLAQTALVRTLTAVVSNIADGETPRPHLEFLAPKQRFRATSGPRRTMVADAVAFAGYDSFADAVATLDAAATAAAYRASEPLFDAAYRELGHPEGFRGALDRAVGQLLAVPVPAAGAELVPHAIGFRWADPRLEGLSAAQKQFLRTGPRNVALVQGWLRALRAALVTTAGPRPLPDDSPEVPPPSESGQASGGRAPA